ncbi:MAG: UTRA domain-containing protein [Alphaproteobacteria bacterium]|nr:UTRA domain-containing protein [Alphaproteobacteria bacterium]
MGQSTTAEVLSFAYVPAGEDIAHALEVEPGTEVQRAVRVRRLDGEPMSYLVTYVPADIGRHYGSDDLNVQPLLHLLERAGVDVASARQTISATVAEDGRRHRAVDPGRLAADRGAPCRQRPLRARG